jgi:hypothetical protein
MQPEYYLLNFKYILDYASTSRAVDLAGYGTFHSLK